MKATIEVLIIAAQVQRSPTRNYQANIKKRIKTIMLTVQKNWINTPLCDRLANRNTDRI